MPPDFPQPAIKTLCQGQGEALVEVGNVASRVTGLPPACAARDSPVDVVTRYPSAVTAQADGWQPPEATLREGYWDGWHRLARYPAPGVVIFPTGLLDRVVAALRGQGLGLRLQDHRARPDPGVPDRGEIPLRPYQRQAVEAALEAGHGVLAMPPRAGKTRTMLEVQRSISRPALWMAPTTNIVTQTVRAAERLFGRGYAVGVVGQEQAMAARHAPIVVCTAATAAALPDAFFQTREMLVADEFHHAAAATWRAVVERTHHIFHRYGLTGTFFRSGEDEIAMLGVLPRAVFQISPEELVRLGFLVPADVLFLGLTSPRVRCGGGKTWNAGLGRQGIHAHAYRNQLAAWAAATLWSRGKRTLVLVGTKEQGRQILSALEAFIPREPGSPYAGVEFVSTDRPALQCQAVIDQFASGGAVHVLIGTSMVGEGTDLPVADALVYAPGGKAEVGHTQATYRVLTADGRKARAVVVDFTDGHHETLNRHAQERAATYHGQSIFQTRVLPDPGVLPAWLDGLVPR